MACTICDDPDLRDGCSVTNGFLMPLLSAWTLLVWLAACRCSGWCVGGVRRKEWVKFVFRKPSSRVKVGFARNEHQIWIQREKMIKIGYLEVFFWIRTRKTDSGQFYCSSGSRGQAQAAAVRHG